MVSSVSLCSKRRAGTRMGLGLNLQFVLLDAVMTMVFFVQIFKIGDVSQVVVESGLMPGKPRRTKSADAGPCPRAVCALCMQEMHERMGHSKSPSMDQRMGHSQAPSMDQMSADMPFAEPQVRAELGAVPVGPACLHFCFASFSGAVDYAVSPSRY